MKVQMSPDGRSGTISGSATHIEQVGKTGTVLKPHTFEPLIAEPNAIDRNPSMPICEKTGRPIWKGDIVPWVAMWSGEIASFPVTLCWLGKEFWTTYGDPLSNPFGIEAAIKSARDGNGVLWYKELKGREGFGLPEFGTYQGSRQRACMTERRCQVCGEQFPEGEPTVFLLASGKRGAEWTGDPFSTGTPPTCERCVEIAMKRCPAQAKHPRSKVFVHEYKVVAACVDVINEKIRIESDGEDVDLTDPVLARSLGRYLRVSIIDYDEEYL